MNFRLRVALFGVAILTGTFGPVRAQDVYHGGSLNARQHGYEHGYRDGYEYGTDTRAKNVALEFRNQAYRDAVRGYSTLFGSREEFRQGYRDGYRKGAEDGYSGTRTRLQETYGQRDFDADAGKVDLYDRAYSENHWSYEDVAGDIGYRDGLNAGLKDFREHHRFSPEEHDAWKKAEHGYSEGLGSKDAFERAYRSAYEAGYRTGFPAGLTPAVAQPRPAGVH